MAGTDVPIAEIEKLIPPYKVTLTLLFRLHPPPAWCKRVQLCGEQQWLHPLPPGPAPHGESINHLSSIPHLVSCYWSACQCQPPCTLYRGDHQLFATDTKLCHVIYRSRFAHCRFCKNVIFDYSLESVHFLSGVVKIKTVILRPG